MAATWATAPSAELRRWRGDGGDDGWPAVTVPQAWDRTLRLHAARPILRWKRDKQQREWAQLTWRDWHRDVHAAAAALCQLGLPRHGAVSILGHNSPEWFTAAHAAAFAGGMAAGVYITNLEEGVRYIVNHSQSHVLFVDAEQHLTTAIAVAKAVRSVRHIVAWGCDPAGRTAPPGVELHSWRGFLALGGTGDAAEVGRRVAALRPGHACYLSYTSGTTGPPKAVMFSHDSVLFGFRSMLTRAHEGLDLGLDESTISFMPLSHIAGSTDIFGPLTWPDHVHAAIHFAFPDAMQGSLTQTLLDVRPTWFIPVPRVWQKLQREVEQAGGALASVGLDRVRWAMVGAAPPGDELLAFYDQRGLALHEIYGMTENTAVSHVTTRADRRPGWVGRPTLRGTCRLDPATGEILVRHRALMMGYMHDDRRTRDAVTADGWLRTGDIGELSDPADPDSFYRIVGRIKELIITAGGENVPPVLIEQHLRELLPEVSAAVVVGDRQKMLTALFTPRLRPDGRGGWLAELDGESRGVDPACRTAADAGTSTRWRALIDAKVEEYNTSRALSRAQRIRAWALLPSDFSTAGGELTPTLKLRRDAVHRKYAAVIRRLYGDQFVDVPWAHAPKL